MKFKAVVSQINDTCIIRKFYYLPNKLRFMTNINIELILGLPLIVHDKEQTSYDDLLDALRLSLKGYSINTVDVII
jgi:hypothetical protein